MGCPWYSYWNFLTSIDLFILESEILQKFSGRLSFDFSLPLNTIDECLHVSVSTTNRTSDIKTESGTSGSSSGTGRSQTQIIIEEAELIRFLQTDEGVDLIAKSHQVSKDDFRKFVDGAKKSRPQVKKEEDGYPTMCSLDGNSK